VKLNLATFGRRCALAALPAALLSAAPSVAAQTRVSDSTYQHVLSADRSAEKHFYLRMAEGFASSILLHESAHVASSYLMGFHPHLGFDRGRPTIFSGIDEMQHKRAQFTFSAAGLAVQDALDELILDVPHRRGRAFERGLLAAGIGTTLFYVTLGRNARVSDISVMARTSNLSKGQISLIFGSVAALHAFRMSRDHRYSRFFVMPCACGGVTAGLSIEAP
jgi:hypothetical protein